ncbi:helix-turn-helix domain-containing protein [Actinomadura alba]|uniref:Helix-turn-helix transcriptional regulator n=1 Tax=Actinomadura alba TaxID=406431 RepID=A0ABR7LGS5_9ACTN|nr:helix-turn-helix domain-containing protein [Actinomadura alba]MBC6464056.1 helix-turn-helix transcriptional regulator [Actinomadura alba]
MVLLRQLLGDVLRQLRLRQGRTLREVSAAARVSLGYLSEVERGQKEASSELLASICKALGVPLSHVLREVSDLLSLAELQHEPVMAGAPMTHERLDEAAIDAERISAESIPATPEEIAGDAFRGDMVAA